eukprot:GDKK01065813.1.p1 GENE.GDKK01065813.1~~GDKK01065813.1.p1  ORF type:complete len:140 (-),score=23.17 GDKK01065813.1:103-522(-)
MFQVLWMFLLRKKGRSPLPPSKKSGQSGESLNKHSCISVHNPSTFQLHFSPALLENPLPSFVNPILFLDTKQAHKSPQLADSLLVINAAKKTKHPSSETGRCNNLPKKKRCNNHKLFLDKYFSFVSSSALFRCFLPPVL